MEVQPPQPNTWNDVLLSGAALAVLTLSVGLRNIVLEKLKNSWDAVFNIKHRKACIDVEQLEGDWAVRESITELRGAIKADRINVWQFHNGVVFSSSNPMWKMSCTHETCKPGVSHEMGAAQSLLSSTITELLLPIFDVGVTPAWVKEVGRAGETPIYWIGVEVMPDGFCKSWLASSGTKHLLVSPLTYKRNIIGLVSAAYCAERNLPSNEDTVCFHDSVASVNFTLKKA